MSWSEVPSLTWGQVLTELSAKSEDMTPAELRLEAQLALLESLANALRIKPHDLASRSPDEVAAHLADFKGKPFNSLAIAPALKALSTP